MAPDADASIDSTAGSMLLSSPSPSEIREELEAYFLRNIMGPEGGAAEQLGRITPDGYEARIDLTLTDDFPLAQAIVIISAIPLKVDRR